jgi:hypothetical protein
MEPTALLLSRIQFAFTISFHIIFPAFSIGVAAWLAVLEVLHIVAMLPAYRLIFEFWLKIFGVVFGLKALAQNSALMHRRIERPYLFVFPAISAVADARMNGPFTW